MRDIAGSPQAIRLSDTSAIEFELDDRTTLADLALREEGDPDRIAAAEGIVEIRWSSTVEICGTEPWGRRRWR